MIQEARRIGTILRKSFHLLINSNPLLLSSATAFFATFALSPVLIITSHLLNLFFDDKIILPKLFSKLSSVFGQKATEDIKRIVVNFLSLETNAWVTIALTVFFYFIATTLLSAVRQSIHQLWEMKKKPTHKVDYHLKERGIEIGMILLISLLFLSTLPIDNALWLLQHGMNSDGAIATTLFRVLNVFFSILVVSTWFTFLFRFMPEALVSWKVAGAGGILTGVLFVLGRLTLTKILVHGKIEELFGPSSSIALVLLFIFYCSFILYFGASFTYEYAKGIHRPIHPGKLAQHYKEKVVETGRKESLKHRR
jgi:membrane protein